MKTPGAIALKHAMIGLLAIIVGGTAWGLIRGSMPDFTGFGAVGVILGLSISWAVQEAYAAGRQAAEADRRTDQPQN